MSRNPEHLYSLNITNFNSITPDISKNDEKLINYFWAPNKKLLDKIYSLLDNNKITDKIIDVGCGPGDALFSRGDYILGKSIHNTPNNKQFIDMDLDFDKFLQSDKYFNFVYCRHTLEDIQNPQNAFAELVRVGKLGYIETPSPLIEITRGADKGTLRGYHHHRYIVWSDITTNTLFFLPKYPLIESITIPDEITKKYNHILNNYSVYWNNYYIWDEGTKPNIFVYRNEINFKVLADYAKLLNIAIQKSYEYTNYFINKTNEY
jgi:SAM-dependent methyltransferase